MPTPRWGWVTFREASGQETWLAAGTLISLGSVPMATEISGDSLTHFQPVGVWSQIHNYGNKTNHLILGWVYRNNYREIQYVCFLQPTKGGLLHTRIYNQSSSCRRMPWPSDQDARNSHDGWDDPGLHRDCLRNHWSFLIDAFVKHSSELHRCMLDHQSPWLPARSALNWPNFWCASKALPSQPPSTSPRARSSCPAGVALGAGGQSDL